MVNTTGTVVPIRALGGSRVTWLPEIVGRIAQVALAALTVSAGLIRYGARLTTVFWLAGIVIVVAVGAAELVAGAVMLAEVEEGVGTTATPMVTV